MKIDFTVDQNYLPKRIHIVPDGYENPDTLHEMSQHLYIKNPVLKFTEDAKNGKYNHLSDREYEKLLCIFKRLSLLFIMDDGKTSLPERNVFDLLVALLYEYMLNRHSESSRIV